MLLLRPTQSKGLYIQQVGRGLRPAPKPAPTTAPTTALTEQPDGSDGSDGSSSKTRCVVIDMVGNTARHGPITGPVTYRWERSSWSYNSKQNDQAGGGTKAAGDDAGGGSGGGGGGGGGGGRGLVVRQANSGGAEDVHARAVRRQKNAAKKASRLFRCRYTSCGALLHGGLSTCPACNRATGNGKGPKPAPTAPTAPTTKPDKAKNAAVGSSPSNGTPVIANGMMMKIPLKVKSKPKPGKNGNAHANANAALPLSPLPR